MIEKEQQIIEGARDVFMRYGIKSVNMDDIARKLRISKKTLYQYVSDKNDLVAKAMRSSCKMEEEAICRFCDLNLNAIDEMFEISGFIAALLKQVHPSIHFDLEKYHPEVWNEMRQLHEGMVYQSMASNLEKGKTEGLYRSDLNTDVITKIYMSKIDILFNGEVFPPGTISFEEVYLEFFRYHIRGIASEKGREYLKEKIKKEKLK